MPVQRRIQAVGGQRRRGRSRTSRAVGWCGRADDSGLSSGRHRVIGRCSAGRRPPPVRHRGRPARGRRSLSRTGIWCRTHRGCRNGRSRRRRDLDGRRRRSDHTRIRRTLQRRRRLGSVGGHQLMIREAGLASRWRGADRRRAIRVRSCQPDVRRSAGCGALGVLDDHGQVRRCRALITRILRCSGGRPGSSWHSGRRVRLGRRFSRARQPGWQGRRRPGTPASRASRSRLASAVI